MNFGLFFDFHNTLVDSNYAWEKAILELKVESAIKSVLLKAFQDKKSRRQTCQSMNVNYAKLEIEYRKHLCFLSPGYELFNYYKDKVPCFIVSNSRKKKLHKDLQQFPVYMEYMVNVYSKADGVKPNPLYIKDLMKKNGLLAICMIGDDIVEDSIQADNVKSIILHECNNQNVDTLIEQIDMYYRESLLRRS